MKKVRISVSKRFMNQVNDKDTFLQNFDTYSDAIFRFCLVKTSSKEVAEDVTQDVFMRYWQALRKGEVMPNTRAFLYTIARNAVIDWYRKKKAGSLEELQDSGMQISDSVSSDAESESEYQNILQKISGMEETDREVLLLRYVEDMEPQEIAESLELSANVVSVRISRAEKRLRKKINA